MYCSNVHAKYHSVTMITLLINFCRIYWIFYIVQIWHICRREFVQYQTKRLARKNVFYMTYAANNDAYY